ncbi:alpha/beta hydrolase [soil metagenome]
MPTSPESELLRALYQDWSNIMSADHNLDVRLFRSIFDEWHQPTREPENVTYKEEAIGGVEAIWCLPIGANPDEVLLYTHGGGFAVGSASSHRKLAAHVAKALGTNAVVIDYRRSPEHPFPAQIDDTVAVYKALLSQGIEAKNITTIGDSAGGNLAVSAVLKLRDEGVELPGHVVAFSPFLDQEQVGETLTTNNDTDALITIPLLQGMSAMLLGDTGADPKNPLVNPLYGDFTVFPKLYVTAGSVESLLDNATDLAGRARRDGADVTLSVAEGMQHVYPFLAGRAPEADEEIHKLAAWYRS